MIDPPYSIKDWHSLAIESPKDWIQVVSDRHADLSDELKKSVFAHIQELDSLEAYLQKHASSADMPLFGVPYLLKDLFHVKGIPTGAGSSFLSKIMAVPEHSAYIFDRMTELGGNNGGIEPLGAAKQVAQEVDAKVVDAVRNFLFGAPGSGGVDLVSLNIQRGRDHGLPDYNSARMAFGLPPAGSVSDITKDEVCRMMRLKPCAVVRKFPMKS